MSSVPTEDRLRTWQRLREPDGRALVEAARDVDPTVVAEVERLRRSWDAPLVACAIELVRARRKAGRKFPDHPDLVADVEGVEQATSLLVARHKARRFAGADAVVDLCCGIGGDAMALHEVTEVSAFDLDPVRAWMTAENAGCTGAVADVEALPPPDGVSFHVDPDRRDRGPGGGRRRWRFEDYQPGPAYLARLRARCPNGAIKLGPGVDLQAVDALLPAEETELEVIAEHGTLVQVVAWTGALARAAGSRTATCLPEGATINGRPEAGLEWVDLGSYDPADVGRFLLVPHPAVERARLVAEACAGLTVAPIWPGLGLLRADEPGDSPWLRAFEIVAEMPWRVPRIAAWLRAHDAGIVTVRTRGGAVDTDDAQRRLRGTGDEAYTVFGLRLGQRQVAFVTRPRPDP